MATAKTGKKQGFQPGKSGNPSGRPQGSRNKATLAMEALLDGETEALTRKCVEKALEGDMTAMRLCLDRICPPRKDHPIRFDMPKMAGAGDAAAVMSGLLNAVSSGEITPTEGTAVAGLVETYRKTLETTELEARIEVLEANAR